MIVSLKKRKINFSSRPPRILQGFNQNLQGSTRILQGFNQNLQGSTRILQGFTRTSQGSTQTHRVQIGPELWGPATTTGLYVFSWTRRHGGPRRTKVNQKWTKSEPKSDTIEKEEYPATPYHKISHYTKKNCVLFVLLFCGNFSQVKGVKIHNPIL